jgi:hypothetical protein
MITYKLTILGDFAQQFENDVFTGVFANVETNQAYLAWLELGNVPIPADEGVA